MGRGCLQIIVGQICKTPGPIQEIDRILRALTAAVGEAAPQLQADLRTLSSLDLAFARACLAEAMDAGFYAVIVPYSYQLLPRNVNLLELNQRWHEALSTNGVSYSDLSDRLAAENVLDHFALGDYIHLNEQGHSLVAEEVLTLIRGELESRIAAGPMADHTMAPRRP